MHHSGVTSIAIALAITACSPDSLSDLETIQREIGALRRADSLFYETTASHGAEGWAEFFLNDGIQFPRSGIVMGKEAIREFMTPVLGEGQPRLTWRPGFASVARSLDLGYTWGRWTLSASDSDSILAGGHYVTVWKKDDAGTWKVAVDIGNADENDGA